jgi:methionine synthase reductase
MFIKPSCQSNASSSSLCCAIFLHTPHSIFSCDSLEETVDPWIKNLWPALAHQVISTPAIHDLPQPHLTQEEEKVVKDIIFKQEQDRRQSIVTSTLNSPKLLPKTAVAANGRDPIENTVEDLKNLTLTSPANPPITPATGYKIDVDFSTMANHANLTALPRVPNANLQIADLEADTVSRTPGSVPTFIQTPTKLMMATVNKVQCLTPPEALKRTITIEFGFEDDVDYAPGDAFGIWAPNNEALVRGVLSALNVSDTAAMNAVRLHGQGTTMPIKS